jgi:hypothetical protein
MTAAPQPRTTNGSNGLAVGGFVTGLLSALVGWLYFPVGIILALVGIVLGIQGRKRTPNAGLAVAGIVLGAIGLAICLAILIAAVVITNN